QSRSLARVDHDDSTFGGLSPLTAILIVLALATLGGLLYGAAGTRRNRDPEPEAGAPAPATPIKQRRPLGRRVAMWTLRRIIRQFT
ncbi:MAG: hypothetical protein ABSH27_11425, partial [Solirubrobacteraceae bacterium]